MFRPTLNCIVRIIRRSCILKSEGRVFYTTDADVDPKIDHLANSNSGQVETDKFKIVSYFKFSVLRICL